MGDNDRQLMLRLPEDLLERADALVEPMSREPEMRLFRMSRSAVMRIALQRGLEVLEERYGEQVGEVAGG